MLDVKNFVIDAQGYRSCITGIMDSQSLRMSKNQSALLIFFEPIPGFVQLCIIEILFLNTEHLRKEAVDLYSDLL